MKAAFSLFSLSLSLTREYLDSAVAMVERSSRQCRICRIVERKEDILKKTISEEGFLEDQEYFRICLKRLSHQDILSDEDIGHLYPRALEPLDPDPTFHCRSR